LAQIYHFGTYLSHVRTTCCSPSERRLCSDPGTMASSKVSPVASSFADSPRTTVSPYGASFPASSPGMSSFPSMSTPREMGNNRESATHRLIEEVENGVSELEDMLHEIEEVSSVLQFNMPISGDKQSTGLFKAGTQGASVLAQQVAEDLKSWHVEQVEQAHKLKLAHKLRLEKKIEFFVDTKDSQEHVRGVVRQELLRTASAAIKKAVKQERKVLRAEVASESREKHGPGASAHLMNESEKRLVKHLKVIGEKVLPIEGQVPEDMVMVTQSAERALKDKRLRARGRRARIPGIGSHLDQGLLEETEESMSQRRAELRDQYDRQMTMFEALERALDDRLLSTENFEEMQMSTGPYSLDQDIWKTLNPMIHKPAGLMQDWFSEMSERKQNNNRADIFQLSTTMQDAITEAVYPSLMRQGEARCKDLSKEFKANYLVKQSAERMTEVNNKISHWFLSTRIELLKDVCVLADANHKDALKQLTSVLAFSGNPGQNLDEHLRRTLSAAEEFHMQREEQFDLQNETAENSTRKYCFEAAKHIGAIRRKCELSGLKRWTDAEAGFNLRFSKAWLECQLSLAEAACKLVDEVTKAWPMQGELDTSNTPHVDVILMAWRRSGTDVRGQLEVMQKVTAALPDTVECCAVTRACLLMMSGEMSRISEMIRNKLERIKPRI